MGSDAGRDNAKRPTPSPMRRCCCGHGERFPRKNPGVFDLLGSSLSCDTTGLTLPHEYLCLRFAELLKHLRQHPKRSPSLRPNGLPQLLCGVFPQTSTLLEQRRAFGHLTPSVDEDLRISYPGGVVPVKPPYPMVAGIDQPSLLHHTTSGHQPISASARTIQLRHLFVRCSPCGT